MTYRVLDTAELVEDERLVLAVPASAVSQNASTTSRLSLALVFEQLSIMQS